MKISWIILAISVVLASVLTLSWISGMPARPEADVVATGSPGALSAEVITLGIIPERDIFAQRRRYLALTGYVERTLEQSTELITDNSYLGILNDYALKRIDGAFLGSLVAVLAMDRYGARVAVKPVTLSGVSTYRGVIFVREDSPITTLTDLCGASLGTVRATTAGNLYAISELKRQEIFHRADAPTIKWLGTHDAVIQAVVEGRCAAGAAKDLRIEAYLAEPGSVALRRIAVGPAVPNNALVLAAEATEGCGARLRELLLTMHDNEDGRGVLWELGFSRFVPCAASEYGPVAEMIRIVGEDWQLLKIDGRVPRGYATEAEGNEPDQGEDAR